jgi:hypothetical protein
MGSVCGCEESLLGGSMRSGIKDVEWDTEECSGVGEHAPKLTPTLDISCCLIESQGCSSLPKIPTVFLFDIML